MNLKEKIRTIPDFPKKGILFYDITTLLKDASAFSFAIDEFYQYFKDKKIDKIIAVESRGFIFAAPLAYKLKAGFIPIRKLGKLPAETVSFSYELEYGTSEVEIHKDAINKGDKVLILDDLLATGGTMFAAKNLIEKLGGEIVGFAFLIELKELQGREKIKDYNIFSQIVY